jgi:hypothetical protein
MKNKIMNYVEEGVGSKKERGNIDEESKKSHWEKYKIYYLIFGSFFFTVLIVLISNSNINNEIRKIKRQSINTEINTEEDQNSSNRYQPKNEYSSQFTKPDPSRKNEN